MLALEETLSGKGTSHHINGIAVQPMVFGPQLPQNVVTEKFVKSRRRSIKVDPQSLPIYNAGKRENKPQLKVQNDECAKEFSEAKKKNLIWMMCRNVDRENQPVNSWDRI